MHVHFYERVWMWGAGGIIAFVLGLTAFATFSQGRMPPSHVETIDPQTLLTDARFANQGVAVNDDGSVTVTIVALMYVFLPNEIRVPAGRPVTFRMSSADVVHGFQIVGTNGNTMIVPGYVSQFTMSFDEPGEYLIACNEFCGVGHHGMYATLIVEEAS
jgi:cytochrome c oxidase subunit 2